MFPIASLRPVNPRLGHLVAVAVAVVVVELLADDTLSATFPPTLAPG
jgi:hypothetical protein